MKIDMSADAVTERLRLTSELRRLCLALGRWKREGVCRQHDFLDLPGKVDYDPEYDYKKQRTRE